MTYKPFASRSGIKVEGPMPMLARLHNNALPLLIKTEMAPRTGFWPNSGVRATVPEADGPRRGLT